MTIEGFINIMKSEINITFLNDKKLITYFMSRTIMARAEEMGLSFTIEEIEMATSSINSFIGLINASVTRDNTSVPFRRLLVMLLNGLHTQMSKGQKTITNFMPLTIEHYALESGITLTTSEIAEITSIVNSKINSYNESLNESVSR